MNRYADLKQRQQEEFSVFPMQFAFSGKQFAEGMAALGLTPTDTDKVYKAPGGGLYRREDSQRLKDMMDRFDRELQEAIAADEILSDPRLKRGIEKAVTEICKGR